jgi:hypothetical protein
MRGHSERRQSADDKVNYCYEAEQRQYIPRKESKKVTHNRKRRQQQKECRRIGPIRIIIIGRRDGRRLGFDEFGRIVQQAGVAIQRLQSSGPSAGEVGVDRQSLAVDDPDSRTKNPYKERSIYAGDREAIPLQPTCGDKD